MVCNFVNRDDFKLWEGNLYDGVDEVVVELVGSMLGFEFEEDDNGGIWVYFRESEDGEKSYIEGNIDVFWGIVSIGLKREGKGCYDSEDVGDEYVE